MKRDEEGWKGIMQRSKDVGYGGLGLGALGAFKCVFDASLGFGV